MDVCVGEGVRVDEALEPGDGVPLAVAACEGDPLAEGVRVPVGVGATLAVPDMVTDCEGIRVVVGLRLRVPVPESEAERVPERDGVCEGPGEEGRCRRRESALWWGCGSASPPRSQTLTVEGVTDAVAPRLTACEADGTGGGEAPSGVAESEAERDAEPVADADMDDDAVLLPEGVDESDEPGAGDALGLRAGVGVDVGDGVGLCVREGEPA